MVSHRFLVSAFVGSNPAIPEIIFKNTKKERKEVKEITKRTIEDEISRLCRVKIGIEKQCEKIYQEKKKMDDLIEQEEDLRGGLLPPIRIENSESYKHQETYQKNLNRQFWMILLEKLYMKKYMLCSTYDKLIEDICNNNIPEFNYTSITSWIRGVKKLIYDNVTSLCKEVFERLTNATYQTSSRWDAPRKKRNNNGVDGYFIITTYDHDRIFDFRNALTTTDDFEKVLYVLSGKMMPDEPLIRQMRKDQTDKYENEYIRIRVYKNGNTHYTIKDKGILEKINTIGAGKGTLGEMIKIKILE